MDTYICKNCGIERSISVNKEKENLKLNCVRCSRKSIFVLKSIYEKNKRPSSGYVLAADMNINCNHIHIDGIPVKGNVTVNKTTGVKLKNMSISKNEEKNMGGKLTITNSEQFSVTNNVISDAKIDSSKLFQIDSNLIGYDFKDRDLLIGVLNSLLSGGLNQAQVISNLSKIEDIIKDNEENSLTISEKIKTSNQTDMKLITNKILSTLKSVGLETIESAKSKGIDGAVQWIFRLLNLTN